MTFVSLRARLIAGLLAVAAIGLLALAAATYAEQRSFLYERVDEQAANGLPNVSRELDVLGANVPGYERHREPGEAGEHGGREPVGPLPGNSLPDGTYGERRDAAGRLIGSHWFTFSGTSPPRPAIPAGLSLGSIRTVSGADGARYRVLVGSTRDQPGTTAIAVPMAEADGTLDRLLVVEALVIAAVLVALAAVAWLLVRLGLRPLDRIGETAGAIAAGDLSRRVGGAGERTEVGRLALALNGMLERLESAFAQREASERRLRRFIADASHELRTPLASIRGYAELFRLGAAREPAETEKAMRRIEEEAARLGVLVEDLLALARLDEVRERRADPVDVAALAADAVADARVASPGRPVGLEANGPAIALGDPDQLRQVLANLIRNALVHTPPGTPVEVAAYTAGGRVGLEVRDRGPGLPPGHRHALFERFWRAQAGRRRGPAGAGLGLAIVAGIVAAHGGAVRAEDREGGGARFVVELPAAPAALERLHRRDAAGERDTVARWT